MATIQERKGKDGKACYRVLVRMKGAPTQTKTFDRKTDAKDWAKSTEVDIRNGRFFPTNEAKRHTFGEMIDRYIRDVLPQKAQNSRHSQEPQLLWWKEQLGAYTLAEVSTPLIVERRDALLRETTRFKKPMSPSTVVRYLAVLAHCYTIAVKEWGWIDDSPLRKISRPKEARGRVRFLSDDERNALLSSCRESANPYLYDVVVLALSTGMRKSELLGLTWDAIDFNRKMITLEKTKNGEIRGVPLVGHALEQLLERNRTRRRLDSPFVFPGTFHAGEAPKPADIESAWRFALERAGLRKPRKPKKAKKGNQNANKEGSADDQTLREGNSSAEEFRFHDLRHSAASYFAMDGASLAEIAEVLGHKTLQMVKRYAHLSQAHTSRVVTSMNAKIFTPIAVPDNQDAIS